MAVQAEPIAARLDERTLRDILRFADGRGGERWHRRRRGRRTRADDGRGSPDLAPSARAAIAPQPLPPDASGGAVVPQLTQVALSFDADAAGGAAADATLRLVLSRVTGKLLPAAPAPSLQSTVGRSHIGAAQARASLIALRADADDDDTDGCRCSAHQAPRVAREPLARRAPRARSSKSRRRTSRFASRSTARLSCGLLRCHRRRQRRRRRRAAAAAAVAARAAAVELEDDLRRGAFEAAAAEAGGRPGAWRLRTRPPAVPAQSRHGWRGGMRCRAPSPPSSCTRPPRRRRAGRRMRPSAASCGGGTSCLSDSSQSARRRWRTPPPDARSRPTAPAAGVGSGGSS